MTEQDQVMKHTADANRPRPYEDTPEEFSRLIWETIGYARVSLKHGTDDKGRRYAYEALQKHRALLSSAPELLEALKELTSLYEAVSSQLPFGVSSKAETARDVAKARAAIAKATGEPRT